jgi:hypothetical protein
MAGAAKHAAATARNLQSWTMIERGFSKMIVLIALHIQHSESLDLYPSLPAILDS